METKLAMASMVWSVFGQNKTFWPEEIMSEVWYNNGLKKKKKEIREKHNRRLGKYYPHLLAL